MMVYDEFKTAKKMRGKYIVAKLPSFLSTFLLGKTSASSSSKSWKIFKSSFHSMNQSKSQSYIHNLQDKEATLIFNFEDALLKSSCLFPYFMLVAFEAGSFARAFVLLLLYPVICMVGKEMGIKIMVFTSFVRLKSRNFRLGTSVFPKYYLEDIGREGFDVVMSFTRKVGVSELPTVMIKPFLKDFLGVDDVMGRELKVVKGYYIGLMDERKNVDVVHRLWDHHLTKFSSHFIGFGSLNRSFDPKMLPLCQEIYLVSEAERRSWQTLPRLKYPKPLIFHDGRLAFKPTPFPTLVMFMWLPLGFFLCIPRLILGMYLPVYLSSPISAFTGLNHTLCISANNEIELKPKGNTNTIYVCNHRTLIDPIYVSLAKKKPVIAVTYSLSRLSELISPIRTFRLTRDREKDKQLMRDLLSQDDLVVCAEGTTCREPYLLRFSPLFAEISDNIVPVAIHVEVPMFYGSTTTGNKGLDPIYHLLNPRPFYSVKFLSRLPVECTCKGGGKSSIEVAKYVQKEIATALGFECTSLTRKDKYMILAGYDGNVKS